MKNDFMPTDRVEPAAAELASALTGRMTPKAAREMQEFFDVNEYPLAVEIILFVLPQEGIKLSENERRILLGLVRRFGLDPESPIYENSSDEPDIIQAQKRLEPFEPALEDLVQRLLSLLPKTSSNLLDYSLHRYERARLMTVLSELDRWGIDPPPELTKGLNDLLHKTGIDARWWETWVEPASREDRAD
jgi:hypothetical protein